MLRRLLGYATYMLFAGALTSLLSFAVDAAGMITRPKEAYGDYHIYLLVITIGMALCIYGPNGTIQKFGAGNETNQRRLVALALRAFLGLNVVAILVAAGVYLIGRPALALGFVGVPWLVMYWWSRYIIRSRMEPKHEAPLLVAGSLSKTVFIGSFVAFSDYRDAMIYGDAIAVIVAGAFSIAMIPRAFGCKLSALWAEPVPRAFVLDLFRFTRPLWVGGQVFAASQEIIGIFTASILKAPAMGALGAMRQFWQFAYKPMDFLGQAALPGLVAEKKRRKELFNDVLRLCLVAFPLIGIGAAGMSPLLLKVLSLDEKFAEVPTMMIIMAAGVPANAVHIVINQYAIAEGHPRFNLYSNVASVIAIGASIYPLAIAFDLDGVVAATWLGTTAGGAAVLAAMWTTHPAQMRTCIKLWLFSIASTLAGLAPIYLNRWAPDAWLWTAPAIAAYAIAVAVLGLVRWGDVVEARNLLRSVIRSRSVSRNESARP